MDLSKEETVQVKTISDPCLRASDHQGKRRVYELFFSILDSKEVEREICVPLNEMVQFHLKCFEQLEKELYKVDSDLTNTLRHFVDARKTLDDLTPQVLSRIEDLDLSG